MAVLVSGQEIVQRNPQQELVARVRGDAFREQVAMALPPTVTIERFVRVATTALLANPDIAKLDHVSVLTAMVRAAADGLMPDGKEAAITPRGGNAVYVPMIGGFRKIAAEHGWTLRTAVVYANDEFRHAVIDGEETIFHAPVRPGDDRGELIAAYAIAKHRDGRRMQVVLHPDDIAKRRASASTQNVWQNHPAAMWEKSAGRDLFAQLGFGELDERVTRILEATATDPAEASRLIYGPPRTETPATLTPAGTDAQLTERTTTSPPPPAEQSDVGVVQQATTAASPAVVAPGSEPEPSLDDEQSSAFEAPASAGVENDPVVAAAREASQFEIPNGQHKGLALSELQAKGEKGTTWLRWALRKGDSLEPLEYRTAVWSFARVYTPELYHEVMAEHEARS